MKDRIMVKLTASGDYIIFRTVTRTRKSRSLYVRRDKLFALKYGHQVIEKDSSFAVFNRDSHAGTVSINFYWLNLDGTGVFTGWNQDVALPYEPFMAFLKRCAAEDGPKEWKSLSVESRFSPRFVFVGTRNLHDALADQLTRRKLCKFLRDNFHWRDSTEILFYDDFIPRSFFFREMRKDTAGMCGGLILHGQENMAKAYYSIHT